MPERYSDWWWEDLPEKARKAAETLGYTKDTWDDDEDSPYEDKAFADCTNEEKRAARYLGMDPIDDKLDIWWEETDEETKKHAQVLGWNQHKWDDDWEIEDLPCEEWWWNDMSDEQKAAAVHFGYSRMTWDETDNDDDEPGFTPGAAPAPAAKPPAPSKPSATSASEEKKDEEEKAEAGGKPKPGKKKPKFVVTRQFGGDGGKEFDHHNHKKIEELTLRADSHAIHQIKVTYFGNRNFKNGADKGEEKTLKFGDKEYIVGVKVRSNKLVQSLTFKTNKGRTLTAGGKGWMLPGKDHAGEEREVPAPKGCMLCGMQGRAGSYIDAIAFRWGPIPGQQQQK